MPNIIVTGSSGFVGQWFMAYNKTNYHITGFSLHSADWLQHDLSGYDAVVHLAGKAHEMKPVDDTTYFDVNLQLTKQLFERSAMAGIPHFIYISSTKVYGDDATTVLDEQSPYGADDAYGKSKQQAEEYLLSKQTAMQHIAVVRPPLVYGPGVKGNMISLLRLCAKKWPLPFGNIHNRRSMVYAGNLAAMINAIIDRQASGIFVAGDAEPLSTTQLVSSIRKAMHRKPALVAIPGVTRSIMKRLTPALYTRLFGSFEVNNSNSCSRLAFTPPFTSEQGIADMTNWYLHHT